MFAQLSLHLYNNVKLIIEGGLFVLFLNLENSYICVHQGDSPIIFFFFATSLSVCYKVNSNFIK